MAESEQPMQVEAAAPIPNETINRLLALVQWTLDQDIQTIEVEASEDEANEDEDDAEDEEVSEEAPDSNV
ncbi:MAG: hypothetical protein V2I33_18355 [Kangiellaceae bacterium]|jgi:hypothetical protein|nr:hypothetical protein [Kangiellaceae bacterium]